MLTSFRLFTLSFETISQRFKYRIAEWQLAGAMAASGLILLSPKATFQLGPYEVLRDIASEGFWGLIFLGIGILRLVVLVINGASPRGSALGRALLAMACAFLWAMLLAGFLKFNVPTLMMGLLFGAFITEFVNIYRAAGDTRTATNGGGNGRRV